MGVYVDALTACVRNERWPYDFSCHLVADTRPELEEFGERLGMKRVWLQKDSALLHFDLTAGKRKLAVKMGAVELDREGFVAFYRRAKEAAVPKKLDLVPPKED